MKDGAVQFLPSYDIREASGEVAKGFNVGFELLDATGNKYLGIVPTDEPAWKVRAHFRRTGDYPFAANEGLTLGPVETPEPGAYAEFEVPADEKKNGLRLAAILGPGHFVWQDGKFLTAEVAAAPSGANTGGLGPGNRARLDENISEIELMLLIEGPAAAQWVKNNGNIVVRLYVGGKGYEMHRGGGGGSYINGIERHQWRFVAPWDERGNRVPLSGPVSIQIVTVEPETVEFIVAPPKLPEPAP